jgi:hypothetical protein
MQIRSVSDTDRGLATFQRNFSTDGTWCIEFGEPSQAAVTMVK